MSTHADSTGVPVEAHFDHVAEDEPRTPGWVTLLGAVLFLAAIIAFVSTRPPGKTAEELTRNSQAATQAKAAAQKPAEPATPTPPTPQPGAAQPAAQQAPVPGCGG